MNVTTRLAAPPATFEELLQSAKEAREEHLALERQWTNPDPDGANYKHGAPLQRIQDLARNADVAAGLVHKRIDAYLRGRCTLDGAPTR